MFKKLCYFGLVLFLLSAQNAQAKLSVRVDDIPSSVNADVYTITVHTLAGSKVTVTGGPNEVPPVTDTDHDGVIEVTIGLIQNSENNFSIRAEKDDDNSDTLKIIINESSSSSGSGGGDTTPPGRPILDDYEDEIDATTITLTGIAEANSTVTAQKTNGTKLATTTADDDGVFEVKVALEQNVRNRINISAKDDAGNTSTAIQAVIVELGEAVEEDDAEEDIEEAVEDEVKETTDTTSAFTDTQNHWAKEYIKSLRIAGIVGGKSEGIFAPNDYLTRAELTKIALNAFDINLYSVSEKPFNDVNVSDWFASYVKTARNKGIVKGYNNSFLPNQNVTRAEAIKILLTTAGFIIPDASTDFTDVSEGAWYENYLAFAKNNGIVGGYDDGTFKPNQPITRAEIAKITVKTMELYSSLLAVAEEDDDTDEDDSSELISNNRLYENSNFGFSLQYYKNWFYEGITGSGDTIIKIGFATVEDAIDNAEATIELKNDSLDDLGKENLDSVADEDEIRYFVEYSDSKHIEIYGDNSISEKIQTMAETLEVE